MPILRLPFLKKDFKPSRWWLEDNQTTTNRREKSEKLEDLWRWRSRNRPDFLLGSPADDPADGDVSFSCRLKIIIPWEQTCAYTHTHTYNTMHFGLDTRTTASRYSISSCSRTEVVAEITSAKHCAGEGSSRPSLTSHSTLVQTS